MDKFGIIHTSVGKISFSAEQIADNVNTVLSMIMKLKPAAAKDVYKRQLMILTRGSWQSEGLGVFLGSGKTISIEGQNGKQITQIVMTPGTGTVSYTHLYEAEDRINGYGSIAN